MKRRLSDSMQYTQGPVDEIFGQKPVLPLESIESPDSLETLEMDAESLDVSQYLRSVRDEAINDRVFYSSREMGEVNKQGESSKPRELGEMESAERKEVDVGTGGKVGKGDGDSHGETVQVKRDYSQDLLSRLVQAKKPFQESFQEIGVSVDLGDLEYASEEEEGFECASEEAGQGSKAAFEVEQSSKLGPTETASVEPHHSSEPVQSPGMGPVESAPGSEPVPNSEPIIPQAAAKWREWVLSSPPPHFSWFYTLDHPTVIRLIILYTKWLSVSMPETLREWIFATFVRLDNAMDHTDISQLRGLGKKAQKVYVASAEGTCARDTARMVLSLLSSYYGQKDMMTIVE